MAEFILSILATARAGSPERAESLLRQFEDQNRGVYISPFSRASYHLALGQTDEAFDYLEVTFAHRETFLTRTLTGPLFASIRSDPRYLTLLRRMNLA